MIKGSLYQKDMVILNIYASKIRAFQYIKQTLTELKGEIESNTIIVGNFNLPHQQWTDHPHRKSTVKY